MNTLISLPLVNCFIQARTEFLKLVNWSEYFRATYNLTIEIRRLLNYN